MIDRPSPSRSALVRIELGIPAATLGLRARELDVSVGILRRYVLARENPDWVAYVVAKGRGCFEHFADNAYAEEGKRLSFQKLARFTNIGEFVERLAYDNLRVFEIYAKHNRAGIDDVELMRMCRRVTHRLGLAVEETSSIAIQKQEFGGRKREWLLKCYTGLLTALVDGDDFEFDRIFDEKLNRVIGDELLSVAPHRDWYPGDCSKSFLIRDRKAMLQTVGDLLSQRRSRGPVVKRALSDAENTAREHYLVLTGKPHIDWSNSSGLIGGYPKFLDALFERAGLSAPTDHIIRGPRRSRAQNA